MLPANAHFKHQIKPYYQEDHLLLQFIMSELIQAHNAISVLTSNVDNISHNAPLTSLAGAGHQYMRLFTWNDDGIMAKLKNYCALFALHFKDDPECPSNKMHREAHKGWVLALEALDTAQKKSVNLSDLEQLAKKLIIVLKRIASFAAKVIERFKENENVLFFLVRHIKQLDALTGKPYVIHIFKKMFSGGMREAQENMIQKYAKRGFSHLAPLISLQCL